MEQYFRSLLLSDWEIIVSSCNRWNPSTNNYWWDPWDASLSCFWMVEMDQTLLTLTGAMLGEGGPCVMYVFLCMLAGWVCACALISTVFNYVCVCVPVHWSQLYLLFHRVLLRLFMIEWVHVCAWICVCVCVWRGCVWLSIELYCAAGSLCGCGWGCWDCTLM